MFYDKIIKLYKKKDGYFNNKKIWIEGDLEYQRDIESDVQPYSKQLLLKEYGYSIECQKRVFCDPDIKIEMFDVVKYLDDFYKIVKIVEWEEYWELMLDGIGSDLSG